MRIGRVGSVDPAPTSTRRQARSGERRGDRVPVAAGEDGSAKPNVAGARRRRSGRSRPSLSSSIAAAGGAPPARTATGRTGPSRSIGVPSSSCCGNGPLPGARPRSASSRVRIRLMSPTSDARPTSLPGLARPAPLLERLGGPGARVTSTVMPAPRPTGSGRTPVDRPTERPAGVSSRRPQADPLGARRHVVEGEGSDAVVVGCGSAIAVWPRGSAEPPGRAGPGPTSEADRHLESRRTAGDRRRRQVRSGQEDVAAKLVIR